MPLRFLYLWTEDQLKRQAAVDVILGAARVIGFVLLAVGIGLLFVPIVVPWRYLP